MPTKFPTRSRAWGTRYDTLDSSPPPSPPHLQNTILNPYSTPPGGPRSNSQDKPDEPDDNSPLCADISRGDKVSHDASIFVGSLPPNVDHGELARLLSEHLSEYVKVKATKIDANAAARLIDTLQSAPPRPLMGRLLRYEPARASRTILVSYRIPIQCATPTPSYDDSVGATGPCHESWVAPTAMRLCRPNGCKFVSVLYNAEAAEIGTSAVTGQPASTVSSENLGGTGVLFCPLQFDEKTVRGIAEAFGKVEHLFKYTPDIGPHTRGDVHPLSHDAPRSTDMDDGIWEVKYEHRNDCVNALATLRRIPFMTATWAHHSLPSNVMNTAPQIPRASFPFQSSGSPGPKRHTQALQSTGGEYQRSGDPRTLSRAGNFQSTSPSFQGSAPQRSMFSGSSTSLDGHVFTRDSPFVDASQLQSASCIFDSHGPREASEHAGSPKRSEKDFPSLNEKRSTRLLRFGTKIDARKWGDRDMNEDGIDDLDVTFSSLPSRSSSMSLNLAVLHTKDDATSGRRNDPHILSTFGRRAASQDGRGHATDIIPPTPGFSLSPITPLTPKQNDDFPPTPSTMSSVVEELSACGADRPKTDACFGSPQSAGALAVDERYRGKEFDPSTIFVGGLEMFGPTAWDEAKLRVLFERYGNIDTIQFVRPMNKRSAFAFIRFTDTDAPARAILEEHNRVYNGRQIRVQLRDVNPQRSPWRGGRNYTQSFPSSPSRGIGGIPGVQHHSPGDLSFKKRIEGEVSHSMPADMPTHGKTDTRLDDGSHTHIHNAEGMPPSQSGKATGVSKADSPLTLDSTHRLSDTRPPSASVIPAASAVPSQHYSVPHAGHPFQNPWMHMYHPQYPYPVPFVHSYSQFPVPPPPPGVQPPGDGGAIGMTGGTPAYWQPSHVPMFNPMMPYMAYPPPPPGGEASQAQVMGNLNSQAPLQPTGFIQGEHGTLIPVYNPEALNQYMSSTQHGQSPPPQSTAPSQAIKTWPPFAVPMYPYALAQNRPPHSPLNPPPRNWMLSPSHPSGPGTHYPHMHPTPPPMLLPAASSSGSISSASSARGAYMSAPHVQQFAPRHTPPPRRFNRRDSYQHNAFNPHVKHNRV
ncbi:hypothetical protein CERSUDRAFT_120789 [Gelatoporia subvermispora B]|uniref:RRM domain-containing protein n=1 Tax=Ceriporiopsis subvermispora (strain B) TaxID=914234 RepID=M2PYA8_CERS8|nr:hypothetical protein CERSUDRAFT_120789 [Gelatoporia subvermispora B]